MQLDVWNNPIVVSAMRQKYRRGSPRLMLSSYVAAMLGLGALLHHFSEVGNFPFASTYLFMMLAIQFVLSGAIALFGTSKSINAEVVNQTLDFQRIVSLDPRSILIGKMLGEPASSYLLALATVPIAVICWALSGAPGATILMIYVNLATWTLLCASIGLVHPLTAPNSKQGGRRAGAGGVIFLLFILLPQLLAQGASMLDAPGIGEALKLLTPLGWFVRVFQNGVDASNAWNAVINVWNVAIPSLAAAPIAQLLVVALIVSAMSRRLKNVNDPPLRKRHAYLVLAALDALLAGVCAAHWSRGARAAELMFSFFLVHYVMCLILLFAVVPSRTAVTSWVWRHCGVRPRLADRLLADRFEVTTCALAMALIGVVATLPALATPGVVTAAGGQPALSLSLYAEAAAVMCVFVVASAAVQQLITITVQKSSHMLYIFFLFMINALTPIVASVINVVAGGEEFAPLERALLSLSPAGYFVRNLSTLAGLYLHAWLAIPAYVCLALLAWTTVNRWMQREHDKVHGKLVGMGVPQASA